MNKYHGGSWWDRNWKWFAPSGCLLVLLLFAGGAFVLVSMVIGGMKSSEAFLEPMAMAQSDPVVMTHLGHPLEAGWFVSGNVSVSGSEGDANLVIPVTGPKGEGSLYVTAHRETGNWCYDAVVLEIEEKDLRINLLD